MSPQNVYYRRTRRHDIPLVTDLLVLPDSTTPSGAGWQRVKTSVSPRGEKRFLWYKAEKPWRDMTEAERKNDLVTELDVLFGADTPWYGFERIDRAAFDGDDKVEPVWLTYRKGIRRECSCILPRGTFLTHRWGMQRPHVRRPCTSRAMASSRSCKLRTCTTPSLREHVETRPPHAQAPTTSPQRS